MSFFVGSPVVFGGPTSVDDSAQNKLGTRARDNEGNEYIYLEGVASVIAGSWVLYDEAFATVGLDTGAEEKGPVAVAMAAVTANKFGWFMIWGTTSASSGDVADNGLVFATSTVFVCDDAAVADQQVIGAKWRGADASSVAVVQLNYPWHGVDEAA